MSKSLVLNPAAQAQLEQGIKPKTRKKYEKKWADFKTWLLPETVPAQLTEIALMNYFNHIKESFVGLRAIHSALKYMAKQEHNVDLDQFPRVSALLSSIEKNSNHVPASAPAFEKEDIEQMHHL